MTPRLKLAHWRKMSAADEAVIRAMMPRTSAADPAPVGYFANTPSRATKTLTFRLGDVAGTR